MAESALVQMRVPGDLLERIDAAAGGTSRTAWLLAAATRQLDGLSITEAHPPVAASPDAGPRSIGPGIPSPGIPCLWASCMQRDTDRYAVEDPHELQRTNYRDHPRDEDAAGHVLCKRHAAKLEGREHTAPMKELPPAWRGKARQQPEPAGQRA